MFPFCDPSCCGKRVESKMVVDNMRAPGPDPKPTKMVAALEYNVLLVWSIVIFCSWPLLLQPPGWRRHYFCGPRRQAAAICGCHGTGGTSRSLRPGHSQFVPVIPILVAEIHFLKEIVGQVALGDTLISVDDHDVQGISDDALAKLIIGPIGTKVACACSLSRWW